MVISGILGFEQYTSLLITKKVFSVTNIYVYKTKRERNVFITPTEFIVHRIEVHVTSAKFHMTRRHLSRGLRHGMSIVTNYKYFLWYVNSKVMLNNT